MNSLAVGCDSKGHDLLPAAAWYKEGWLGNLSSAQSKALAELKRRFPTYGNYHDDHDLLRFLRARDFDIEATTTMYRRYLIDYRGASGLIYPCGFCSPLPFVRRVGGVHYKDCVETLTDIMPHRDPEFTRRLEIMREHFLQVNVFNCDKLGRPVVYMRAKHFLARNMVRSKHPIARSVCNVLSVQSRHSGQARVAGGPTAISSGGHGGNSFIVQNRVCQARASHRGLRSNSGEPLALRTQSTEPAR
eukprot:scaffold1481_cov401-Prasinococcus_capsulatus_cf.AAC.3